MRGQLAAHTVLVCHGIGAIWPHIEKACIFLKIKEINEKVLSLTHFFNGNE